VADIALAALAVLIGEDDLAGRAIVDEGLVTEDKAVVKELAEDPLGPLIIIISGGIDHAVPVKGETDTLELIGEFLNIFIRDDAGMGIGLDRIVLGGQTKSVETNREQYIVTLHSALSGNYLNAGICLDMADMHSGSAGIGKLHQAVEFGLITEIHCLENTGIFPFLLPLRLNLLKIVSHVNAPLSS
jgi:hypothetical protein